MTDEPTAPEPSAADGTVTPAPQENKKPPGVEPDKPPPDEFLGRGNKKKKVKPGKQRPVKTQVEEQIDAALASSSAQVKQKQTRKKQIKYGGAAAGVLILGFLINMGLQPYQGTMAFGICKVFLESTVRYPHLLRISTVEEFETSVRIWYTQIDSFGEYRMEPIQCYYKQEEGRGTIIDKVLVNRREVERKTIESFNNSIPVIIDYPPDLTIPYPLPDSLQDLQIDAGKFRKPVI
jgi:hypothetical protein